MPTKKFLKKKNNITKKNKQSGGLFGKNLSSGLFGSSKKKQEEAKMMDAYREKERKKKSTKANIELVMKAKKGLDKYKEKGDFLYKLSEKANEDDESHQFIKNNLYYLTLGILETAYEAYDYESKEGKKDEDKEIIKKNINDLTEIDARPKIEEKVIFDQLDLIKMLNNKQKATLKANLFILSLSDLKFKGKEEYGDGDNKSILNIIPTNPAKNEEQNGGGGEETLATNFVQGAMNQGVKNVVDKKIIPIKTTASILAEGVMDQGVKNVTKKTTEQETATNAAAAGEEAAATPGDVEEKKTNPNQPLTRQDGSRNLLQDADRKLITRPEQLTQYIEGKGSEAFQTGKETGDHKLGSEQNIFLKKILLHQ